MRADRSTSISVCLTRSFMFFFFVLLSNRWKCFNVCFCLLSNRITKKKNDENFDKFSLKKMFFSRFLMFSSWKDFFFFAIVCYVCYGWYFMFILRFDSQLLACLLILHQVLFIFTFTTFRINCGT